MLTKNQILDKAMAEVEKTIDEFRNLKAIKFGLLADLMATFEKEVAKCSDFCNCHLEIVKVTSSDITAYIILEPTTNIVKEVSEKTAIRRASGPHIFFNESDDWRKYLQSKPELAKLRLNQHWCSYQSYTFDKKTNRISIPVFESGVFVDMYHSIQKKFNPKTYTI